MTPQPSPQASTTVVNALGIELTLHVDSPQAALAAVRHYASAGFLPKRTLKHGGVTLPYAQHDTFDFRLLGARPYTDRDGNLGVLCDGHFYKKRVLEAVDSRKMKLPPVIKYSRGAKNSDPDHLREKTEGDFEYVTLISFKGGAKPLPAFNLPGGAKHAHAGLAVTAPPEGQAAD